MGAPAPQQGAPPGRPMASREGAEGDPAAAPAHLRQPVLKSTKRTRTPPKPKDIPVPYLTLISCPTNHHGSH